MNHLRAIYTLWLRDMTKFKRERFSKLGSIALPLLFLFVLGPGIATTFSSKLSSLPAGVTYMEYIYSGVLCMHLLFTSVTSSLSMVWDREFGFLKEVLVSPTSRWAVVVGRVLGGTTIAMIQATFILLLAPIVGISLSLGQIVIIFFNMFILAFAFTSMGVAIASFMKTMRSFQPIINFLMMPMFMLSGALYNVQRFPEWLRSFSLVNPFAYGVEIMRHTISGIIVHPIGLSYAAIFIFATLCFGIAIYFFERHN